MNWYALLDPLGGVIVFGGTLAGTLLRAGRRACGSAIGQLAQIGGRDFDFDNARAQLAAQVEGIRQEGLLRAPENQSTDHEISAVTDTLIRTRSGAALVKKHQRYQARRKLVRSRALEALTTAGDLAPIFGLAGTLLALSQLPSEGLETGALMATVAMAVVTTLYGLLAAHVLFYPLARLVERRGEHEEAERQRLVDWLEAQLVKEFKPRANRHADPPSLKHPIRRTAA